MYLTGHEKPDFRTICNFKKECEGLIETAFKETVTIAKALGILNLEHISTDGTKMKANASNKHTLSKEEIEWIRRIIARGIAIDKEEDKLYGDKSGDELPPEHNTQEKISEKIKEIEEASGQKMKGAAKKIIVQHVLGDMMKCMTNLYALMARYSLERGRMCIKVSYSTPIMVRTVVNVLSGRNVPVKAEKERKKERSQVMTTRQNVGGWQVKCVIQEG